MQGQMRLPFGPAPRAGRKRPPSPAADGTGRRPRAWQELVRRSRSQTWDEARQEWQPVRILLPGDPGFAAACELCHQPGIASNWEIANIHTNETLLLGRECILHYVRYAGTDSDLASRQKFLMFEQRENFRRHVADSTLDACARVWAGKAMRRAPWDRRALVTAAARALHPELSRLHRLATRPTPSAVLASRDAHDAWIREIHRRQGDLDMAVTRAAQDLARILLARGLAPAAFGRYSEAERIQRLRATIDVQASRAFRPGLAATRRLVLALRAALKEIEGRRILWTS